MRCFKPQMVKIKSKKHVLYGSHWKNEYYAMVPCGKCDACKINKRKSLFVRLKLHEELNRIGYFVTLTLDDENYEKCLHSLRKYDFQCFFKRFRRYLDYHFNIKKITYFACGEYGELTRRPHYHFLVWGVDDLSILQEAIDSTWNFGFNSVSGINDARLNYVCKYMLKQQDLPHDAFGNVFIGDLVCSAPFYTCSKKLGLEYFQKNFDYFNRNGFMFYDKHFPVPKYYNRYGLEHHSNNVLDWAFELDPRKQRAAMLDFNIRNGIL